MIISKTPYRISFFGGGTDYHTWYNEYGGAVLSTSINHYCYISCRYLPPFFDMKSKIVWKKIEEVVDHAAIEHPVIRETLKLMNINEGLDLHHQGDLPARAGLGSSSAFTVGLLNALYALQDVMPTKKRLASEAINIEREILKENVGIQDQIATAYGGFNKITIDTSGNFEVHPIIISKANLKELQKHFLLFFTGISRTASTIAGSKIKAIPNKKLELQTMRQMVDEAITLLATPQHYHEFGKLLHESWQLKRSLSADVSNNFIDEIYDKALKAGALGGKILGAGGGGFILFFAPPERHPAIMQALENLLMIPFEFESAGSTIVFYDKVDYSRYSKVHRDFIHLQQQKELVS